MQPAARHAMKITWPSFGFDRQLPLRWQGVFRRMALACMLVCSPLWAQPPSGDSSPRAVSLIFAGDTTLDSTPGERIRKGGDPLASFAPLFAQADVRLLNLECAVATLGSALDKHYTFRAHPRVLPVLKRHVDAVTLANNHSGDFGREAFMEMLGLLKQHGIAAVGGGHNLQQAHTPWIVERQGLRLAILSYNEFMPRSYEADAQAAGVAWSEDVRVVDDIRQARAAHRADVVLLFMHWGWENELVANARQRQLARLAIDAGADGVIGGHPHVTQDIDIYRGKPIVYSVGNFVMKETDNDRQRQGWVIRLRLDAQGVAGFDTHVARIDRQGLPTRDTKTASPCWQRGWSHTQSCAAAP
jgi:poly-gamma-glutamate synthesis protein (capsule biosynthesis protein)